MSSAGKTPTCSRVEVMHERLEGCFVQTPLSRTVVPGKEPASVEVGTGGELGLGGTSC